jgi:uncharacterized SAM-binding protein YcdF (DUF218 family)
MLGPMLARLLETLVLPPASVLGLLVAGALLRRRLPRTGLGLQIAAVAWLWLASTPLVGGALLNALQVDPPLPADGPLPAADAIVVLSAEADRGGREYGGPVAGPTTMQRLRYGAHLQRRTGLPMLCAGGPPGHGIDSLGELMRRAAEREFGAKVRWVEDRSADTFENAAFSAPVLRAANVRTVLLVTSAWHLPRAAACFRAEGFDVVPAPTAFRGTAWQGVASLLPHWAGLRDTCLGLHEWIGGLWYVVRR